MDSGNSLTEDQLKSENEFLKMKLMLEKGAEFGSTETGKELPPILENEFLKQIMEFEKQWENAPRIKVFDKIGRPVHFKPVDTITVDEIGEAWDELSSYLRQHGVSLEVCSPNISPRELYRFATEELFQLDVDDIGIPGLVHGFIYDEFHPDEVYDNTVMAIEDCLKMIFRKDPLEWTFHYKQEGLRLNDRIGLTAEGLKELVNRFKGAFDEISPAGFSSTSCKLFDTDCTVSGVYAADAVIGTNNYRLEGNWEISTEKDTDHGVWLITGVTIQGINF